jgi:hypothetical protein
MLFIIQLIHTIIALFIFTCIFYVIYCGVVNKTTIFYKYSLAVVLLEGIVIGLSGLVCPFRRLVDHITGNQSTPDILFPGWMAERLMEVGAALLLFGMALHIEPAQMSLMDHIFHWLDS